MTSSDAKEKDIWGRPCTCQGLNPTCFKCGGFGMLREPPIVSAVYESFHPAKAKWSKSGKSFVIDNDINGLPAVVKKKKSVAPAKKKSKAPELSSQKKEVKKPTDPLSSYSYYCSQCNEYLKPFQLFDHSQHVEKILSNPRPQPVVALKKRISRGRV
jgi:hypothetical protein